MTAERLEDWYARALRLYPAAFRAEYAGPMRQAFHDALADGEMERGAMLRLALRDLAASLWREQMAAMKETFGRPALVFNALVLAGIATVLGLALYAIPQQVLRQGANDPQIQMATDLAARLSFYGVNDGLRQGALVNGGAVVNVAQSLSPFVIVYDDQGRALGATGQLNGETPTPPGGVFDFVRAHGEERVSWQPERGVRVAAVVERVNGTQPGFVLAGRSLREVEKREAQVGQMARLAWLAMMGLIVAGAGAFGWMTRRRVAA